MKKKRVSIYDKKNNVFIQHGFHIWVILIIANVILLYSLRYYILKSNETTVFNSHAQAITPTITPTTSQSPVSPTVTTQPSQANSPTPTPAGQILSLSFSLPAIGSGGANLNPIHKTRTLTVFLYSPDVNTQDPTIQPLYAVQGTALYDANTNDPTYTQYINNNFALGTTVQDGSYQIAIKSDYTLRDLIKTNPGDIGGTIFTIQQESGAQSIQIPHQVLIQGAILPSENDSTIDINDYNAFVSCFGVITATAQCPNPAAADFNDDGVVNGIDYNYLLNSFKTLLSEGQTIPTLPPPTPTQPFQIQTSPTQILHPTSLPVGPVTKIPTPTIAKIVPAHTKGGGAGIFIFLLFLIIVLIIILYFVNDKVKQMVNNLLALLPFMKAAQQDGATQAGVDSSTPIQQQNEVVTQGDEISGPNQPIQEQNTLIPSQAATAPIEDNVVIEKEYYIKKISLDQQNNLTTLILTGDEGQLDARYRGTLQIAEGFAKIKGIMRKDKDKNYLEVQEVLPDE